MREKNETLLVHLSVGDLQQLIKDAVKEEVTKITEVIKLTPKTESSELLTRKQVCEILDVSATTLHNWNKDGTLPIQKMKHRVYYQRSAIMNKLNNVA